MSSQPSPSASNRATPAPMVSGRYFLPARPLLWMKRTPEAAVTSVNRIPGCGAGTAALGAGAAAARPRAARARAERMKGCLKILDLLRSSPRLKFVPLHTSLPALEGRIFPSLGFQPQVGWRGGHGWSVSAVAGRRSAVGGPCPVPLGVEPPGYSIPAP